MYLASRLFGFLSLASLALTGCHELGHVDGLGDYGSSNDIVGEVQNVDTRAWEIEIRTDSGRTSIVRYDNNTQVVYQQRNYSVDNLERGDYVDSRRGTFEIRDQRNRLIVVSVAFNAPRSVTEQFNHLRNGDYVRIEGRSMNADRFELENFL